MHAASFLVLGLFANGANLEADIFEHSVVEKVTPVEEEGWVHQRGTEHVF